MKSRPRNAGFMLAELIVAAVITAAAGALLAGALVAANRSSALRGQRALATQWLASQLALLPETAAPGEQDQGTLPAPSDQVAWAFATGAAEPPLASLTAAHWSLTGAQSADVITYRPITEQ